MKKIYVLIICILPLFALAQPTVTQADLPVPGLVYILGTDTASGPVPAGGASQTWNYASLLNTQSDTTAFGAATATPYQGSFPTANLTLFSPSANVWSYFSTDATGMYAEGIAGAGTPTGGILTLTPHQLYAPVPFTYNDSRSDTSRIVVDTVVSTILGTFNAQFVRNFNETFLADGWGTLILPNGTYNNALRIKITEVIWDSAYYDPLSNGNYVPVPSLFFTPTVQQSTTYRWYQDQQPVYLLGILADSLGDTAVYSEYLLSSTILSNQTITLNNSSVNAFPNPANGIVNFNNELGSEASLIVSNAIGEEIERRTIGIEKLVTLDVRNYASGFYSFTIVSGNARQNGKFTVRH